MMFTLVTAEYNYGKYLPRLLQGCFDQTDPRWRLIIVDDASSDVETRYLLRGLRAERRDRVQVILKKTNTGVCDTLRIGFKAVQTPYCAAIDSDNFLLPRYVELMLGFMESHPGHVGCTCDFLRYEDMESTGEIIYKRQITLKDSPKQPPGTMLATWRTEIALKSLPKIELAPDFDMVLRGIEHGPMGHVSKALVGWEDHQDSRWWQNLEASKWAAAQAKEEAAKRRRRRKRR